MFFLANGGSVAEKSLARVRDGFGRRRFSVESFPIWASNVTEGSRCLLFLFTCSSVLSCNSQVTVGRSHWNMDANIVFFGEAAVPWQVWVAGVWQLAVSVWQCVRSVMCLVHVAFKFVSAVVSLESLKMQLKT